MDRVTIVIYVAVALMIGGLVATVQYNPPPPRQLYNPSWRPGTPDMPLWGYNPYGQSGPMPMAPMRDRCWTNPSTRQMECGPTYGR